jgi:hypothetical protein
MKIYTKDNTQAIEINDAAYTNISNLILASATAASCDLKSYTNGTVYCGTDATGAGSGDGADGDVPGSKRSQSQ